MSKVILKNVTVASNNKLKQLDAGEIAIVTDPSKPSIAFKDKNDSLICINQTEFEVWDTQESSGSVDKNGFYFNKTAADLIQFTGNFTYTSVASANGDTLFPTNTLRILKNGVPQPNVTFTYSSDQPYATVGINGEIVFASHTNTSQRAARITVRCFFEGKEYTKVATATQSAYIPDVYALTGKLIYSGNVNANGGTITPTNTLGITKNGSPVSGIQISYSSNQTYATVANNGNVTFTASTSTTARTATITATVSYNDHTFQTIATATQAAYVPDVIVIDGSFSYGNNIAATGGTANILSNTLSLKKNGSVQSGITFVYQLNDSPSFATINTSTGSITFQNNTGSARNVSVSAKCVYNGYTYTSNIVTVTQSAYVAPEDVYALTGNLTYSGNADASGGTLTPINTLGITKNGSPVSGIQISYSSNQTYATVSANGNVTFTASTSTTARTATITAIVSYNGHTFQTIATATQAAYVEPSITGFIYAGGAAQPNATISVDQFNEISSSAASSKEISFLVNGYNIISVLCPENLTLTSCKIVPGVDDNIASKMSVTTVTYKSQTMKMYQYRYATGLVYNQNFVATFI